MPDIDDPDLRGNPGDHSMYNTNELVVTHLHPGVSREHVAEATGWTIRFAPDVGVTVPPTVEELAVLRDLHARTAAAHSAG